MIEKRPNRRQVIQSAMGSATALALTPAVHAIPPFVRTKPEIKLSLAAYSFGKHFRSRPADDPKHMTMPDFLHYCVKLGLDGAEPTSYFFPSQISDAYLAELKRIAHINGLDISGGAIATNFTHGPGEVLEKSFREIEKWSAVYAKLGAPVIRIFAGQHAKGDTPEKAIERAIPNIEKACEISSKYGVMLAIENHDFSANASYLRPIVEGVKSPWFGVNLDTGNFRNTKDPYKDIAEFAPYAINVQLKVALAVNNRKEDADYEKIVNILKEHNYRGYLVLEYEDKVDPYLAVPEHVKRLQKILA